MESKVTGTFILVGVYRATPNGSTKLTLNLLTMGREVSLPAELVFGSTGSYHNQEIAFYSDYVDMLKEGMQHAHEIARKHMSSAAVHSKEFYDAKISLNRYKTGDLVWCLQESRKVGIMTKLQHTYEGPFLIKTRFQKLIFCCK